MNNERELKRLLGKASSLVLKKLRKAKMLVEWWQPEEVKLLGTAPDSQIAARIGRRNEVVRHKRQTLHIPAFDLCMRFWTSNELALIGTMSDLKLADRLKRSLMSVQKKRYELKLSAVDPLVRPWSANEMKLVQRLPAAEVARRTGRTPKAVRHKRRKLGFPRALMVKGERPIPAIHALFSEKKIRYFANKCKHFRTTLDLSEQTHYLPPY
jgi:hypothetical protein